MITWDEFKTELASMPRGSVNLYYGFLMILVMLFVSQSLTDNFHIATICPNGFDAGTIEQQISYLHTLISILFSTTLSIILLAVFIGFAMLTKFDGEPSEPIIKDVMSAKLITGLACMLIATISMAIHLMGDFEWYGIVTPVMMALLGSIDLNYVRKLKKMLKNLPLENEGSID